MAYIIARTPFNDVIGGFVCLILGSLSAYGALGLEQMGGGQVRSVAAPELAVVGLGIIVIGVVFLFDGVVGELDLGGIRGSR
jgi:multisubunit Na+/H+ antiporter MnhG subunit